MYDHLEKKDKTLVSESMSHEHDSSLSEHRPMTGLHQHPKDDRLSELFNIHSSFDNISVGADTKGNITIAVSSEKELHSPTLGSDRKLLKGSRRRILYEHFGELYTNSASPTNSAFAYKGRRVLSENRLMSELKRASERRLSPQQREMAPFLTLDDDRARLQRLREKDASDSEAKREKGETERSILRKTELENRFLRKLRIARRRSLPKEEEEKKDSFLERLLRAFEDLSPGGAEASDGTSEEADEESRDENEES